MAIIPVVRASDNRKGIIAAIAFLLVTLFLLFFIKYSEPDPPKVTVPIPITMSESGIEDFEIHNAGGGAPSEAVNPTPAEEQPKEQPTQEESPVQTSTGQGTSNTANTKPAETPDASPFSGGGTGGSGTAGSGGGFGSDSGPGSGIGEAGKGGSGDRIRITQSISNPKTDNNEFAKIAFKLLIDSRGKVVRADVIRANTTTTNQELINEVTKIVKAEVLYKEKPGAPNELVYYTVSVSPN